MEASALPRRRASVLPRSRRLLAAFSDERLVEQIRRGNEVAFEVIFDRHHRAILSFCRHMLGSQQEAEDAVQQTFASAFSALHDDDREIRLKAWLYAIARNKSLSILRARREQPAELEEQATSGLSDEVQQRADLRELLADLRTLPEEQREALVLFELGDLSHAEIAEVIGVEPMKVKALVFQARTALIENREAREIPCDEIRERLATATGGELRRGPLRRHLKSCEGCAEYRDMVKKQRRALAALLPVIPTAGLKAGVLGAIGIGGGAGGAGIGTAAGGTLAGGGVAAGGGAAAAGGGFGGVASLGASKIAVGAMLATGAVAGGGLAVDRAIHHDTPKPPATSEAAADPGGAGAGSGAAPVEPVNGTPIANTTGGGAGGSGGGPGDSGDDGSGRDDGDRRGDDDREDSRERGRDRDRDGKKNGRRGGASDGRRNEGRGGGESRGHDDDDDGKRGNGNGRGDDDDDRGDDDDDRGDDDGNRGHGNDDDGDDDDNPGNGGGRENNGNGNGNGRGNDDKKDDRRGGPPEQVTTQTPPPPPPANDDDAEGEDDDDEKDDKDRVVSVFEAVGEATARP